MPTALGLTTDTKTSPPTGSMGYKDSSRTMGSNQRLDTISKRNHAAAHEMETLLWRAFCDSPDAAKEYLAEDCVMINPMFNPEKSSKPMSKDTDPSIEQALKEAKRFTGFRFHGTPLVVEIDLMAVALVYKVTLYRHSRKGGVREITASVSSSWRQTAGADWLLCAMHVQKAEAEEGDETDGYGEGDFSD
ncbi:hypothetical protein QBC35DRAFT_429639 [Podospora australis]|uniref:DUF4440 domain-containing protein n=1 Tax=Podospora australis TaxID=1536484 RepID=A0AAN6WWR3_9PEZI|nr:hypothetical protein QBC35DRAFT_429639 [Podospora australis]